MRGDIQAMNAMLKGESHPLMVTYEQLVLIKDALSVVSPDDEKAVIMARRLVVEIELYIGKIDKERGESC